jgi:hypothetical protein
MPVKTRTKRSIPKRPAKVLGETKPSQIRFASEFREKNARRKAIRLANATEYSNGRRNRSELATHGAFGNVDGATYNECVLGTTGVGRTDNGE